MFSHEEGEEDFQLLCNFDQVLRGLNNFFPVTWEQIPCAEKRGRETVLPELVDLASFGATHCLSELPGCNVSPT